MNRTIRVAALVSILQRSAHPRSGTFLSLLGKLGPPGLLVLAILDGSPIPTFGGPDILIAILSARHREPWFYLAGAATVGSVIGACVTYRMAHKAGAKYLREKFGKGRFTTLMKSFKKWGTGILAASCAVPLPTPTTGFLAAAGVANYPLRLFVLVVALSRAARYSLISIIADHYGRHFVRVVRHPGQYWPWLLLMAAVVAMGAASAVVLSGRLSGEKPSTQWTPGS